MFPASTAGAGGPAAPTPTADAVPAAEPLWGADGAIGGTAPIGPISHLRDWTLDRDTGAATATPSADPYDPSVAPWTRAVAFDRVRWVDGEPVLSVASQGPGTPVAIESAAAAPAHWARHTGTFRVNAIDSQPVPIPSVAPTMRILGASLSPASPFELRVDQAGNYTVIAAGAGEHTLTLQVAVDPAYTAESPGRGAVPPPAAADPAVRDAARPVLRAAGIGDRATDAQVAQALAAHLRTFDERPLLPHERSSDIFADVARARAGVCRHRAFVFVVAATAAGVPARFVANDAHAFVEVHIANHGWWRIDLGGAATPNSPGAAASADGGSEAQDGGAENVDADPSPADPAALPAAAAGAASPPPAPTAPAAPIEARPPVAPRPTALTLTLVGPTTRTRDQAVTLSGVLTSEGRPVAGAPVEIRATLQPSGVSRVLGDAVTTAHGAYIVEAPSLRRLAHGRWTLSAHFAGGDGFAPGASP